MLALALASFAGCVNLAEPPYWLGPDGSIVMLGMGGANGQGTYDGAVDRPPAPKHDARIDTGLGLRDGVAESDAEGPAVEAGGTPDDAGTIIGGSDAGVADATGTPPDATFLSIDARVVDALVVDAPPPPVDAPMPVDSPVDQPPVVVDMALPVDAPPPDPRCRPFGTLPANGELIDDFEDGTLDQIVPQNGRTGEWFAVADNTPGATLTRDIETLASCPHSKSWLHVQSRGFQRWGSDFGVRFVANFGAYDLRPYAGIQFWARKRSPGGKVRFLITNRQTDPRGNVCNRGACYDHFGRELTELGTDWTLVTVLFTTTELHQEGWGFPIPPQDFDLGSVFEAELLMMNGADYDLQIDDVALIRK